MQTHYLRITRCEVCKRRPVWFSGMCRSCCHEFVAHRDLWALERYLDKFYPFSPADGK